MRPLFAPRRVLESTPGQVVMSGGGLGIYGNDPIDNDLGFTRAGGNYRRDIPPWTRERSRDYAVTSYRTNPMATAVIDTYTAFCVGDSGVSPQCADPDVKQVVDEFWNDHRNRLGDIQEMLLRSQLLLGETVMELMQGPTSGVVRFCPYEPAAIKHIRLLNGNPLWPNEIVMPPKPDGDGEDEVWQIVQINDDTGLREGQAIFWAPFRSVITEVRGTTFLGPILDWLDNYDTVLSNLIDRTAIARYAAYDVEVQGDADAVANYVKGRGGTHLPPSGSIEVHNQSVKWNPLTVSSGADEDTKANGAVLTNIASGAGLNKTWLAEPEGTNRATSHTMAEPVRRRVGGVQKMWLGQIQELVRFAVDRAVAAKRLPGTVTVKDPRTGAESEMPAAMTVTVTGPEIAAADASITAQVLLNLSTGLQTMVEGGMLSREAASLAAQKGWEDYMGVPYRAELAGPGAQQDDIAGHVDATSPAGIAPPTPLTLVG